MMSRDALNARIRDRLSPDWLTPSQAEIWDALRRFDGAPHRVIGCWSGKDTPPMACGRTARTRSYLD
jgi:hypothetical protein